MARQQEILPFFTPAMAATDGGRPVGAVKAGGEAVVAGAVDAEAAADVATDGEEGSAVELAAAGAAARPPL